MSAGATTVFVTDGDQRAALAMTRSLGRRGVSVIVGETRSSSLASCSKYCTRSVVYPPPGSERAAFQRFLLEFVEREQVDVVMPVTDATMEAASMSQDALRRHTAVAVPPYDAFALASDKWSLLQHAAACDVPIPRTRFVEGADRLEAVLDDIRYPAVVKPARSGTPDDGMPGRANAHYVSSAGELRRLYRDTSYLAQCPALIQERIIGPGAGVFLLFDRGRPLAAFAHRRLREKPPSGGVSVLSQSVRLDPRLLVYAVSMLSPLLWHGVAMVEFKRDAQTGRWILMEVNGRFWGSLQLAIAAGVDFPHLTYQLALGRVPDAPQTYKAGVKNRWLLGDLDHLLARLFNDRRALHLPDSAPSRGRALVEFLKLAQPGLHYEIIDRGDLRPMLYELRQYAKNLARARKRLVRQSFVTPPADASRRSLVGSPARIRVCHVMSADLWAGPEVQLATAASYLMERPEVELSAVLLNEGRLAAELRELGVHVTILDEHRYSAVQILTRLRRLLKESRVTVVHTHRYKDTVLGATAAKLAGVPHVVRTVHGLNEELRGWALMKFRAYDALDRMTLSLFGDRIIAVSKQIAESLRDRGHRAAAVMHIHNGVDLRKMTATRSQDEVRRELGIAGGVPLVGTVGRLSPVKGHRYLLEAGRLILQRYPDARLLIVGDGPLRSDLAAAAARLGVAGGCVFAGRRADVHDLIAAMDVFVMPSVDEGIPMALLEAMALGRPVVATAVGGMPEIITHHATGLLVAPRDERALADACIELVANRAWAQRLGAAGRRAVEDEFSREKNGEALMNVYGGVAPTGSSPSCRVSQPAVGRP